jgi:hypothetical protein
MADADTALRASFEAVFGETVTRSG